MTGATARQEERAYTLATELPLLPLVVVAQLFLFVTGAYLWGPEWPYDGALLYILMVVGALGIAMYTVQRVPEAQRRAYWARLVPTAPVLHGVAFWFVGFWLTYAVVLGTFELALGYDWPTITPSMATVMLFFTVFFVAPTEELLFRGVLPNLNEERYVLGKVPLILVMSQVVFALFHYAAYGGIGSAMVITFALGLIWVFAARRWSLYATMGSHTAYNLCVLGVLSGGVL